MEGASRAITGLLSIDDGQRSASACSGEAAYTPTSAPLVAGDSAVVNKLSGVELALRPHHRKVLSAASRYFLRWRRHRSADRTGLISIQTFIAPAPVHASRPWPEAMRGPTIVSGRGSRGQRASNPISRVIAASLTAYGPARRSW